MATHARVTTGRVLALPTAAGTETLVEIAAALTPFGLILRGGFHLEPAERTDALADAATLLLIGNAGPAMWDAFAPAIDKAPDPLNRWTKRVVEPLAARFGARALYPFGEPHWPFQRWAQRAEAVHPSPLGLLIHPEFGLWHAYRAALVLRDRIALPSRTEGASPCERCATRPCLSACPVSAFSGVSYDVAACASYIAQDNSCVDAGCHARQACPVGEAWRYPQAQTRFHMSAFARAVGV